MKWCASVSVFTTLGRHAFSTETCERAWTIARGWAEYSQAAAEEVERGEGICIDPDLDGASQDIFSAKSQAYGALQRPSRDLFRKRSQSPKPILVRGSGEHAGLPFNDSKDLVEFFARDEVCDDVDPQNWIR